VPVELTLLAATLLGTFVAHILTPNSVVDKRLAVQNISKVTYFVLSGT